MKNIRDLAERIVTAAETMADLMDDHEEAVRAILAACTKAHAALDLALRHLEDAEAFGWEDRRREAEALTAKAYGDVEDALGIGARLAAHDATT